MLQGLRVGVLPLARLRKTISTRKDFALGYIAVVFFFSKPCLLSSRAYGLLIKAK